jgi:hypothetical protein
MFASFVGDFPLLAAATIGLQALRAFVATSFAQGGEVTRPTLAMIGEGGEREIVGPTRTLKQVLMSELIPEIIAMARISVPPQPQLAYGGSYNADMLRETKALRRELHDKDFSTSLPGMVTMNEALRRNVPRYNRELRKGRK